MIYNHIKSKSFSDFLSAYIFKHNIFCLFLAKMNTHIHPHTDMYVYVGCVYVCVCVFIKSSDSCSNQLLS